MLTPSVLVHAEVVNVKLLPFSLHGAAGVIPNLAEAVTCDEATIKRLGEGERAEYGRTLIDHIQAYLYQKKEWRPREENAFTPALCNRIDRNTGGIVIAAKTAEALRVMNQKIKDRELDKRYLAIVEGTPKPRDGSLKGYLFKDAKKNRVFVTDTPQAGSKSCQTNYKTLVSKNGLSLVECELITGRTHQIRAQFSGHGYPLVGDHKYGSRAKETAPMLYSCCLEFEMNGPRRFEKLPHWA